MPPKQHSASEGRTQSKFCRIIDWVQAQDSALAAAIERLCMVSILVPRRGRGVTFLFPAEADLRKEIVDKSFDDPEGAIRLLSALTMPVRAASAEDFRGAVGSRLGVAFEVASTAGGRVELKNGAVLAPSSFAPLLRDNIAVWLLKQGRPPLEGPSFELPAARGGEEAPAAPRPAASAGSRKGLALAVERDFAACMAQDRCRSHNPYLARSLALLNFLKHQYPAAFAKVMPLADRDPAVTFYLLVEPRKQKGSFLLADAVLFGENGWNDACISGNDPRGEYLALFEGLPAAGSGCKVFEDPAKVRNKVDEVRRSLIDGARAANKNDTPKAVLAAYQQLEDSNQVAGFGPVLPDATVEALRGGKKLWQDEQRFAIHSKMRELFSTYSEGLMSDFVAYLCDHPGDDYAGELTLVAPREYDGAAGGDVAPRARFAMMLVFVQSLGDFLYTAAPAAAHEGAADSVSDLRRYDLRNLLAQIYNSEASKTELLGQTQARPAPLGASCIAQVQHYFDLHGSLPSVLSDMARGQQQ